MLNSLFSPSRRLWVAALATVFVGYGSGMLSAQETPPSGQQPRKLAPGVLTVIPPEPKASELIHGPRPFPEITTGNDPAILHWDPN